MLNLLNAHTAGCAIFLAFLVVTVRRDANAAANRWLGAFLLLVGLFMLDDSLVVYGIYRQHPRTIGVLNLPNLARFMNLSVHEMSELINMGFDENFAQFINRYRVEESKRLLLSEKHAHLSMVGIAFEAGFNSKTAFNMAFKKMVGVSPTAYREKENVTKP